MRVKTLLMLGVFVCGTYPICCQYSETEEITGAVYDEIFGTGVKGCVVTISDQDGDFEWTSVVQKSGEFTVYGNFIVGVDYTAVFMHDDYESLRYPFSPKYSFGTDEKVKRNIGEFELKPIRKAKVRLIPSPQETHVEFFFNENKCPDPELQGEFFVIILPQEEALWARINTLTIVVEGFDSLRIPDFTKYKIWKPYTCKLKPEKETPSNERTNADLTSLSNISASIGFAGERNGGAKYFPPDIIEFEDISTNAARREWVVKKPGLARIWGKKKYNNETLKLELLRGGKYKIELTVYETMEDDSPSASIPVGEIDVSWRKIESDKIVMATICGGSLLTTAMITNMQSKKYYENHLNPANPRRDKDFEVATTYKKVAHYSSWAGLGVITLAAIWHTFDLNKKEVRKKDEKIRSSLSVAPNFSGPSVGVGINFSF